MTRSQSFQLGDLRCHLLEGGMQRLDGGAMFGVVPKPLWSRRIVPDERNRILLAMRCLLIEHPDGLVLIDSDSIREGEGVVIGPGDPVPVDGIVEEGTALLDQSSLT